MPKFQDLTGKKFGLLTVKYYAGKNNRNKNLWYCECDCGGNKIVEINHLNSGRVKSCGCIHKLNLIGQKFGKLTVIDKAENDKYGSQRWKCKCDCGSDKVIIVPTNHLTGGHTKSCGCIRYEINYGDFSKKYNTYDLTGEYGIGITYNSNKEFYFDLEDYDLIKDCCWSTNKNGYIVSKSRTLDKHVQMHRLVMGVQNISEKDIEVDHINWNKLDNRKANLRIVSKKQNDYNRPKQSNNQSGYTGISKRENGKYIVRLTLNRKTMSFGTYDNIDDAIKVRLQAELKYFGKEFAPQRHLFEQYGIE